MEKGSIKINKEKHLGFFLSILISFFKSDFSFPRIFSMILFALSKCQSWRMRCSFCHKMCHQLQLLLASTLCVQQDSRSKAGQIFEKLSNLFFLFLVGWGVVPWVRFSLLLFYGKKTGGGTRNCKGTQP